LWNVFHPLQEEDSGANTAFAFNLFLIARKGVCWKGNQDSRMLVVEEEIL